MRNLIFILAFLIGQSSYGQRLVAYVNPMVGTKNMGHTFPGACSPFGMVQLSPDTEMKLHNIDGKYQPDAYRYCAGYQYDDSTIVGFSHTHLNGTGHSDLGDILVMPATGPVKLEVGDAKVPGSGYRSRFRHETEHSEPGYYSVTLDDYGIKAELTATERTGVHRYTFPKGTKTGHIIIDLSYGIYNYDGKVLMSCLRVEDPYTLTGYRITSGWARMNYVYFAVKFSKPILSYGCHNFDKPSYVGWWRKFDREKNFPEMFGKKLVSYFDFDFSNGQALVMEVSLSPVDCIGAMKNMEAETKGKSFDELKDSVQKKWEKELSVLNVKSDDNRKRIFYTALYRTMINPSVYQDVDGRYRGVDGNIHQAEKGGVNYTVFSLWDTHRAEHPLMNLIKRSYSRQFVNSMLNHYRQSAEKMLPVWSLMGCENWCMIGYHAVSVISDAIVKGLDVDRKLAMEACESTANVGYYDGIGQYKKYGYLPSDFNSVSASVTLEYSYDDWAIAALAKKMGRSSDEEYYLKRAGSYKNIFDRVVGFACPKDKNGKFDEPFDFLDTQNKGFIEGNAWNYSFYVPHDVEGLIREMGGEKRFLQRLDSLFTMHLPEKYYAGNEDISADGLIGNYVHGNEPSHHVPYLYAWTSQPWKSQFWLHTIMDRMYRNKPDGLCGNDDCGQMSAWYVFSAMGFYPVCPGTDQYVIGSPNEKEITINLENGNKFVIEAPAMSDRNIYVQSVLLNGKPYEKAYIRHEDIMKGGSLFFKMSARPNKKRIFNKEEEPYSLSEKNGNYFE